jgi:hypothetical protein
MTKYLTANAIKIKSTETNDLGSNNLTGQDDLFDKDECPDNVTPELMAIYKRESTNLQWKKLFLNISLVVILTIIALCQGDGKAPSFAGVSKCNELDMILTTLLILLSAAYFLYAIFGVLKPEYE